MALLPYEIWETLESLTTVSASVYCLRPMVRARHVEYVTCFLKSVRCLWGDLSRLLCVRACVRVRGVCFLLI